MGSKIIPPPPPPPAWLTEVVAIDETGGLDTPLGYTLWRALRSARLWLSGTDGNRAELFPPFTQAMSERYAFALTAAPDLTEPLGVFALLQRSPDLIDEPKLAAACGQIYEWADRNSLSRTAMHFAEVAAHAQPDDPVRCNIAGRACRTAGHYPQAHDWYERGFLIAKRGSKRPLINTAVRSQLGLGRLLQVQGRLRVAARYFVKAVRRSSRRDRRPLAAEANHDMFACLAELGLLRLAMRFARGAVDFYGPKHARFPYAVHDFTFLLIRWSFFRLALELLDLLPPYFSRPGDQALIWSTQAWAASVIGDARCHAAEERTLRVVGLTEEHSAAALIHLAEGARARGDWDRADRYAVAAAAAARRRANTAAEREAEELRVAVSARDRGATPSEPRGLVGRVDVQVLVDDYKRRLRRWRGPDPGGPGPTAI